ncbi:MAG: IgGFc-binding protein [Deltaproteobacteria bacterium]|nr:IgGFc-binding protein [Deltaproteobacteria bacterium]
MRRTLRGRALAVACVATAIGAFFACSFDPAYRQQALPPETPICTLDEKRCDGPALQRCERGVDGRAGWATVEDCSDKGLACASAELGCKTCRPGSTRCGGDLGKRVDTCRFDGSGYDPGALCEGDGKACRAGICDDLCAVARARKSNIGCEYWAVHLDNARISASLNATAQQYAVVVSNPQGDVAANVTIEQDDAKPGEPANVRVVAKARLLPQNLEVFLLGPRWVDGSTDITGTGETHTAVTRHAYKVTSDVPIIAYQFNPLENVNVFSNDASLLKPVEAIGGAGRYVAVGWPQTIARDSDPNKDFSIDLRQFLTIVGTRPDTAVTVKTRAAVVSGGPIGATPAGGTITYTLQPFEVLNLETGSFHADFSGSIIDASGPVVVFSGSEASDAPAWNDFAERACCADHLEEQLDPARTAGRRFVVARSPNRARAVAASGASGVGAFDEPDFVRIITVTDGVTHVRTTLPNASGLADFYMKGPGEVRDIEVHQDFTIETDGAVHVSLVQSSQEAANIPQRLPGGDPSLVIIPPIEQFRSEYVFLTPDKYAFDFVTVMAPKGTQLLFDGIPFDADACERAFVAPAKSPVTGKENGEGFDLWRCQLSFPVFDPMAPVGKQLGPGRQNDGVHRLQASRPVGLVVYGFDAYVSYAYAGGTELEALTPR